MRSQRTVYGWVLRLDPGEEIVGSLQAFATREQVRAAFVSGIGSVGEAELGFYHSSRGTYDRRLFTGDREVGSLTGNLSVLEGLVFAHCHMVLSGADLVAHTGHLFRGVVSVTCEIQVVTDPGTLVRLARPDLGYNPLDPR